MAILEFARVNGTRYELADKQSREALETKAEIDGYYEEMTVGDAEQLVSTKYVEDSEPYKYRTTGGSADVGNRAYLEKIVGGTIALNQIVQNVYGAAAINGITRQALGNGKLRVSGTSTSSTTYTASNINVSKDIVPGHVFFLTLGAVTLPDGARISISPIDKAVSGIAKPNSNVGIWISSGVSIDVTVQPQMIDLTQMFGSAIADHIYALDQANAGAGVAWFRNLFPKDYYEYNAGELISVEGLQKRKTVGFNLWDEEWEQGFFNTSTGVKIDSATRIRSKNPIAVFPSTNYYIKNASNTNVYCFAYDADMNLIDYWTRSNAILITPANCYYLNIALYDDYGATYKGDVCINLSWSGTRNGEYAAYESHEYPLDSSLTLRGIPKLVDGEVKWDGDEYTPDGKVNRRYGIVDLGTLTWAAYGTYTNMDRYLTSGLDAKAVDNTRNALCTKYPWQFKANGFTFGDGNSKLSVLTEKGQYADVASFKAAMSGVYLVYELATPTEEEAEPFTEVQIVDDWGTEEFISDSIVPVGHETRYPANLRDKLQHLPDLASGDGNYLIEQNGSQMILVPFRIPKAPTTDGTYALKATVSGGTPTYTWEAEE